MERSQRHQLAQVAQDLRRDHGRAGVTRTAVDDAMADAEHARAAILRAEPRRERVERGATVAHGMPIQLLIGEALASPIFGGKPR